MDKWWVYDKKATQKMNKLADLKWIIKDYASARQLMKFYEFNHARLPGQHMQKMLSLGQHLLFCNPSFPDLNGDGYFNYQSPSTLLNEPTLKYQRRMWTHGEMRINGVLALETEYVCVEKIKFIKKLQDCHVVGIERVLAPSNEYSRNVTNAHLNLELGSQNHASASNIVSRSDSISKRPNVATEIRYMMYMNKAANPEPLEISPYQGMIETIGTFTFTDLDILRYTQLTLNPHRIHWDRDYCRKIEGFKNIIVPGPFTLQVILEFAKHYFKLPLTYIKYRNVNYIYAFTEVEICVVRDQENVGSTQVFMRDAKIKSKIYVTSVVS